MGEESTELAGPVREILALTRDLITERDPDALLQRIAHTAARAVDAERATIFTHDASRHALVSRVALGLEKSALSIPDDAGIAGHAWRTLEDVVVDDAYSDPRFLPELDAATGFRTRTVMAVPMRGAGAAPLGVLQVLNKRGSARFSTADRELLAVVAAQAAIALENARAWQRIEGRAIEAEGARERLTDELSGEFIGRSQVIAEVRALAQRVAASPVTVLITGESGTGKSHIARLIHYKSPRAGKPFVYLNCAALPAGLVESELFGIEKGVATGVERNVGRIEQAQEGTLFLDEIADMSLDVQAKVLMVLQERELVRVGGRRTIRVDVRLISATNKDLAAEVRAGRFREDLFYRLSVVNIWIPPLRERKEDVDPLIRHLLERVCEEFNRRIPRISPPAREALLSYDWPGNVREVDNEVRRIASLAPGDVIEEVHLSERVRSRAVREKLGALAARGTLAEAVRALEEEMIRAALETAGGNKVHAARVLGLSREGLRKKMKRYGLAGLE